MINGSGLQAKPRNLNTVGRTRYQMEAPAQDGSGVEVVGLGGERGGSGEGGLSFVLGSGVAS